jgi:hypothetical protein
MRNTLLVVVLGSSLVLTGCGDTDRSAAPQGGAAPPLPGGSAKAPAALQQEKDQLLLAIIPDPPTADGCLKVLVSTAPRVQYRWEVNGETVAGQHGNLLCEGFRRGDEIRITASDGRASGSRTVTVANAPPRLTEVAIDADAISRRTDLCITSTVFDADDDPVDLRYQWFVNGEADPFLSGDTLPAGRYVRGDELRFTILPADGSTDGPLYQSDTYVVPNAPPQLRSEPPRQFSAYEYRYQVEASDPDADQLAYTLAAAPPGMTIDRGNGLITWPLTGVAPGEYPVKIVVSDPDGAEAYQLLSLTLGTAEPPPPGGPANR